VAVDAGAAGTVALLRNKRGCGGVAEPRQVLPKNPTYRPGCGAKPRNQLRSALRIGPHAHTPVS
jgi:hypothetical protein